MTFVLAVILFFLCYNSSQVAFILIFLAYKKVSFCICRYITIKQSFMNQVDMQEPDFLKFLFFLKAGK